MKRDYLAPIMLVIALLIWIVGLTLADRSRSARILGTDIKIKLMDVPHDKSIGDTVYARHMEATLTGAEKWFEYRRLKVDDSCYKVVITEIE